MKKLLLFILLIVGRGINNIKCSLILRDVSYDENSEVTYSESTHVYEKWGKFNSWVDNVDGAERECAVGKEEEISARDNTLAFDSCYY